MHIKDICPFFINYKMYFKKSAKGNEIHFKKKIIFFCCFLQNVRHFMRGISRKLQRREKDKIEK